MIISATVDRDSPRNFAEPLGDANNSRGVGIKKKTFLSPPECVFFPFSFEVSKLLSFSVCLVPLHVVCVIAGALFVLSFCVFIVASS